METQISEVAKLNDEFRKSNPAQYTITCSVSHNIDIQDVVFAVRHYSSFNEDNDPFGEHDFGNLTLNGFRVIWKIDYYDQKLEYGIDALDPLCRRVLTVMLASEY